MSLPVGGEAFAVHGERLGEHGHGVHGEPGAEFGKVELPYLRTEFPQFPQGAVEGGAALPGDARPLDETVRDTDAETSYPGDRGRGPRASAVR
nr:hypothetical protein [Streptomyces sp. TSRI0281]